MHGVLDGREYRIGFISAISLTGGFLLYYFGLGFLAAVEDLPGDRTVRELHDAEPVSTSRLLDGVRSRERANSWIFNPKRELDIGILQLELARRAPTSSPEHVATLRNARDSFAATLRAMPLASYAWNGLAIAESGLDASGDRIERLFQMSIVNAPVEERLGVARVAFGLLNENWLTGETKDLVRRQIRLVARLKPNEIIPLLTSLNRGDAVADYLHSVGGYDEIVDKLRATR